MKLRIAVAWVAVAIVAWVGGCTDSHGPQEVPPTETDPLNVSNPVQSAALAPRSTAVSAAATAATDLAYVSLDPGAYPGGQVAEVTDSRTGSHLYISMADGGFDPVPVIAGAGDALDFTIRLAGQGPLTFRRVVPLRANPGLVRTYPPPRKRDVALNGAVIMYFSEPIAKGSLTGSAVQLFRGTSPIAGTVSLLEGAGSVGAFTPAAPLDPNADYQLVVTQAIRDLDGDALAAGMTLDFTTGESSTGPPASISLQLLTNSDTLLYLVAGATYPLTATVRDAAGNILIDQPVTWASSDPNLLAVSQTGLMTALGDGFSVVTASVSGLSNRVYISVSPQPAASVTIAPTPATVTASDTTLLTATVSDATGRVINQPSLTWTSSDPAVATVAAAGYPQPRVAIVSGVSQGSVTITATTGGLNGTAAVTVGPQVPVASVTVTPGSATLVAQGRVQLSATLRDANGKVLFPRPITWTSDNEAVATVDANGLVTAVGTGPATVTATSEGVSGTAAITITTISFGSVIAGQRRSCGVTTGGAAYCWGGGLLGNGSTNASSAPVAVTAGLTFSAVSAGNNTCGVTSGGVVYCWGFNYNGELGNGSTTPSSVPVAVTAGGLTFTALSAGNNGSSGGGNHACAVSTSGAVYCWGFNGSGQLGNGSISSSSFPVAVTGGGLTFTVVSAGGYHTCGVTTSAAVYCWGSNYNGELGNGSTTPSSAPVAVTAGGLTFSAVSAGSYHTCGLTTSRAVYCWGFNGDGQLGNGSTTSSSVPVAVSASGLTFTAVSVGSYHTCGVATSGVAYCWGSGASGQLGTGSGASSLVPVVVSAGGLTFSAVSAGGYHTCGLSTAGIAYCWGSNDSGELGDGTTTVSAVPVKVAGQP